MSLSHESTYAMYLGDIDHRFAESRGASAPALALIVGRNRGPGGNSWGRLFVLTGVASRQEIMS